MTEDDFLDQLAAREGTRYAAPPAMDQPTGPYGVTLPTLTRWRGRVCTVEDLKALTATEGREIARAGVRSALSALHLDRIPFAPLRYQLLDFGWQSGTERAIRWLQRTVGLPEAQCDGILGDRTIGALQRFPPALINNALAAERAHADYHGAIPQGTLQAGAAHRALEFVVPVVGDRPGEQVPGVK